ncbi:MAG: DUF459 domain-containing protein [Chloroflexota bacterium]|nr:DUF459 domain-containing protein [Chloroflexota bacterium]
MTMPPMTIAPPSAPLAPPSGGGRYPASAAAWDLPPSLDASSLDASSWDASSWDVPAPRVRRRRRRPRTRWSGSLLLALLVHCFGPPRRSAAPSSSWSVFLALNVCLAFTALLTSPRLVRLAEGQPDGPRRDRAIALARRVDVLARSVGLDRPVLWVTASVDGALGQWAGASFTPFGLALPPPASPAPATATSGALGAPGSSIVTPEAPPPAMTIPADPAAGDSLTPDAALPLGPTEALVAALGPAAESPVPGLKRAVTAETPLRVYVAGDSFAEWLGYDLARFGAASRLLTTQLDFRLSSGLAHPARYNWPRRLAEMMAGSPPPEAVVLFLGANDYDHMYTPAGVVLMQTPAWQAEYARRAAEVMDIVGGGGARLYWVGVPVLRDGRRNATALAGNAAAAEAATTRPWVRYVDIWPLFADPGGRFTAFRPGPLGELTRVRQDDGIHLTRTATTWVASQVHEELKRDWSLAPSSP